MLANDVLHTIGNTPHIRINRLFGSSHNVYVKSERSNPGGSIKDRIAVVDGRGGRGLGRAQAGRDDRRADLGQHGRRPGDGRRRQGLSGRPRHARQHERRAAPPDARLRRAVRADAAREGHQRRDRARRRRSSPSFDRPAPGCRSSSTTPPTSTSTCARPRRRSLPTSRAASTRSSPASAPAATSPAARRC